MRTVTIGLALAFIACSFGRASAADAGFADSICPEATQYVRAVGKLRTDDPPQKVYDAAQAAVDAYALCSKDKLANGFREPQHYADTRGGGLAIVAARALIALNRSDDARRELLQYRAITQNVVDWQSDTETPHTAYGGRPMTDEGTTKNVSTSSDSKGANRRPSVYRNSARDVVAAADALLAQIARDVPRPQAQTSPSP
jgi:hypothetical protein